MPRRAAPRATECATYAEPAARPRLFRFPYGSCSEQGARRRQRHRLDRHPMGCRLGRPRRNPRRNHRPERALGRQAGFDRRHARQWPRNPYGRSPGDHHSEAYRRGLSLRHRRRPARCRPTGDDRLPATSTIPATPPATTTARDTGNWWASTCGAATSRMPRRRSARRSTVRTRKAPRRLAPVDQVRVWAARELAAISSVDVKSLPTCRSYPSRRAHRDCRKRGTRPGIAGHRQG